MYQNQLSFCTLVVSSIAAPSKISYSWFVPEYSHWRKYCEAQLHLCVKVTIKLYGLMSPFLHLKCGFSLCFDTKWGLCSRGFKKQILQWLFFPWEALLTSNPSSYLVREELSSRKIKAQNATKALVYMSKSSALLIAENRGMNEIRFRYT